MSSAKSLNSEPESSATDEARRCGDSTGTADRPSSRAIRLRPRSLRARLAFWHAGLLAVTLILLSGLTLLILRSVLSSRADEALYDYADKTAARIATALYQGTLTGPPDFQRLLSELPQDLGRSVQVVDARTGSIVAQLQGLTDSKLPLDMDTRIKAMRGQVMYQTVTGPFEHPVRIVTVPVQMGESVPYMVQSAGSLEGVEYALQRTSAILLILTPLVFGFSLLGGWKLVGGSLRPVDEMTRTAMAMEPGRLDHRVEPTGSDDEIARLASAFNEMMGRLDRSFRQIRQFSADASHELKTPLTSIRGEAEVALMGDLEPEQYRKTLRSIVDEVERMSAIVENLLLLARADAEQVQLRREPLALEDLVLRVYEQMEGIARRKGVGLEIGEIDSVEAQGDSLWLGQILTNLVNNAVKYTPSGGKVTLALRLGEDDRSARISVTDTGHGIAPEHLPRLFDRFYRVDSGRSREAGGVGLGLNIAQWAAHSHGGEITVESKVGQGTTFTLVLPLEPPHPQRNAL
jgi:two-component system, OmpR family, sensor kinase